ncbi:MAG: hypothetical protein LBS45_06785 [Synergistaceae bacterium]|nr:hypothetical protein [Synergistaceae bacterium]
MYRGKIKLLLAIAAILALAFYIRRDMNLTPDFTLGDLPDVSVENLDFRRRIRSRDWHLRAKRAEHDSGVIRAFEMEIDVSEADSDGLMSLRASNGEFSEADYFLEVRSLDGVLFRDGRSMDVLAPQASYERSPDVWLFNRGIELWDEKTYIKGGMAAIASDGVFVLWKGAYVSWAVE